MGRFLCRFFAVLVLAVALINFSVVFKNSPAFNGDERQRTVVGGWRVPNVAAHYDKAEYLQELAYGYLNDLGLAYDPETKQTGLIDPEEMNARTARALELIEQVVRLDPSNASAWTYLAQAQARSNDMDGMRVSLNRSWRLAPNNFRLAALRLPLVMALIQKNADAPEEMAALSEDEVLALQRDGQNLQAQQPRFLARFLERSEPIRTLLSDMDSSDKSSS